MRITVLSVSYPLASVSEDSPGGAEQVLSMLDSAIVSTGCRSVVVAPEGSRTKGRLITTPAVRGGITQALRRAAQDEHRLAIRQALKEYDIDVIHMHGVDFDDYLPPPGPPVLATLHLPLSWYPKRALKPERPGTYLNCVSRAQTTGAPAWADPLPVIENGVPVEGLSLRLSRRSFALSLGRVCPEKGFHIAIDAARAAGVPLILGGKVFLYGGHERYFDEEIAPRLDGRRYRFVGPLDFRRKRRFLSAARCLLVPSLAPETSSLVAMEAMACGTPVIAYPSGALPEVVEDGVTGFLVKNRAGMASAILRAGEISPDKCRKRAMERHSSVAASERYLRHYEDILRGRL